MKRKVWFLAPVFLFTAAQIFSQAIESGGAVSSRILNNDFYVQSLRLTALARHSYETGDYDASTAYAEEATKYARLSDEYVASHALFAALARLNWASSDTVHADSRYPRAYQAATTAYTDAESNHSQRQYSEAVEAANRVFEALSAVTAITEEDTRKVFPARYTVRTWASSRDCLWNIAGRSWAYGDSAKWRLIYNANRDRLPDPSNPDLIEPGIILEIPSIHGEPRQGLWTPSTSYPSLP